MRSFLSAISFLTIIPVPHRYAVERTNLSKTSIFFPVVGLLIGLFVSGIGYLLYHIFPAQVATIFVVALLASASGALHLDGLADTCDGFLSARPRDKVLAIMRDSRVGTMGVVGIIFLVIIKWTSLANVSAGARWATIVLMPLTGRTALLVMMALLPYARSEGGLASAFLGHNGLKWWGVCIGIVLLVIISIMGFGKVGVIITATSLGVILVFCGYCYGKIGGYTGDTLGAICEISEVLPALMALVILRGGGAL